MRSEGVDGPGDECLNLKHRSRAAMVRPMSPVTSERELQRPGRPPGRRRELLAFLFLTVVLSPVLAVAVVGGYGFLVWISQMIYGPPGPPAA